MTSQSRQQQPEPREGSYKWVGVGESEARRLVECALKRNMFVRFMVDKMEEAGCTVGKDFIRTEHCDAEVGGGFRPPDGVVICHNHLATQEEIEHAITHELIHAYDHCRAKNMDWTNCEHHACSEIRAAALSGDCNFKMEVLRGNLGLRQQHQKCVKRRAELSVRMNPYCGGMRAAAAVDKVFAACFADSKPFDRIP